MDYAEYFRRHGIIELPEHPVLGVRLFSDECRENRKAVIVTYIHNYHRKFNLVVKQHSVVFLDMESVVTACNQINQNGLLLDEVVKNGV